MARRNKNDAQYLKVVVSVNDGRGSVVVVGSGVGVARDEIVTAVNDFCRNFSFSPVEYLFYFDIQLANDGSALVVPCEVSLELPLPGNYIRYADMVNVVNDLQRFYRDLGEVINRPTAPVYVGD